MRSSAPAILIYALTLIVVLLPIRESTAFPMNPAKSVPNPGKGKGDKIDRPKTFGEQIVLEQTMPQAKPAASSPFFSMGKATHKVPKRMYSINREKLLTALRNDIYNDSNSDDSADDYVIYLEGGRATTRYDSDHEPVFRQESYFHYLFGVREPDYSGAIYVKSGKTVLFAPKLPSDFATIMGSIPTKEDIRNTYEVDEVLFTEDVEGVLVDFCRSNNSNNKVLAMKGRNSDSGNEYLPPTFNNNENILVDNLILFPILAECRVQKSQMELDLIRYCTEITSFAHVFTMKHMKPGMMEYQGESLFRHYVYYNFGARNVGYTSICGCGPSAAVLHYGHAGAPNERQLQDGDMCLFDMGAEYFCYGSDITCSFPTNSNCKFLPRQRSVYEGVLNAQRRVIGMLKPGVSWLDCHKAAEEEIIKALIELNVVILPPESSHTVEDLVDMRLGGVFMPHGLGHFIGIDTHDVGGYLPGNPDRSSQSGLRSLRTARTVKKDMTLTIEPGCYFIDHLIDEALAKGSKLQPFLNKDVINKYYRGFGGVRLEDVVVITEDTCENYTLCPRTVDEVEGVMAGGKWPPLIDTDVSLKRKRLTSTIPSLPFSSTPV